MLATLDPDDARAFITDHLARLEQGPPDAAALCRAFVIADMALGAIELAFDREARGIPTQIGNPADPDIEYADLTELCHRAYLAAILLARTIDLMPGPRTARLAGFRRTATNMMAFLERLTPPEARAFRARVLGEPHANN
jgi:hypothetical protein